MSSYLRSWGIPCLLYIDDRLTAEVLTCKGPRCKPWDERSESDSLAAAKTALFIVATLLIQLSNTIGLSKSVLNPTKSLEYLGFIIDTEKQAFQKEK